MTTPLPTTSPKPAPIPPAPHPLRRSTPSENARRRTDTQCLRNSVLQQTPSAPFDPCKRAPHSGLPLWRLAHMIILEIHEKAARRRTAASATRAPNAEAEAASASEDGLGDADSLCESDG